MFVNLTTLLRTTENTARPGQAHQRLSFVLFRSELNVSQVVEFVEFSVEKKVATESGNPQTYGIHREMWLTLMRTIFVILFVKLNNSTVIHVMQAGIEHLFINV